MEELAYKYARSHYGHVSKVEDYRFEFKEYKPGKPKDKQEPKTYWVMLSYFTQTGKRRDTNVY